MGHRFLLSLLGLVGLLASCTSSRQVSSASGDDGDKLLQHTAAEYIVRHRVEGEIGDSIRKEMAILREVIEASYGDYLMVRQPHEGLLMVLQSDYLFQSGLATIREKALPKLEKLCQILSAYPYLDIYLLVHTDNNGSEYFSQRLSDQRAKVLKRCFRQQGIHLKVAEGKGAQVPVITNENEQGRRKNRRVELALVCNQSHQRAIRKSISIMKE